MALGVTAGVEELVGGGVLTAAAGGLATATCLAAEVGVFGLAEVWLATLWLIGFL